tara:strand:- start:62 stop:700 length:639 start_codon:yes stop_codon:yes gene_type:complete
MPKKYQSHALFIDGPVGQLEAILDSQVEETPIGTAIICHPHPLYGGTMDNKVAHTLSRAFIRSGYNSLRFNFRGTKKSEGKFDFGIGELDDLLAVIKWMKARDHSEILWLAGFSFGAAIAINASSIIKVDGLISVAPAVEKFTNFTNQPQCPWLILQGDEDELVDIKTTIDWLNTLNPGPELLILSQAEHFFHGRLLELREKIFKFVQEKNK